VDPDHLAQIVSARLFRARTLNAINHSLTAALRELENQQFALNQHAIVCITNVNGVIIHVNDKLCEISGYTRSELVGRDRSILHSGRHDRNFYQEMWSTIESGKVWQGDVCNRKKNGDRYWTNTTIVPFLDEQSRPYQYVSINSDITTKKFIEQDLMTARDAAVNASQAKSDFISKISHEQRAPLNAVLGFSQILSAGKDGALTEGQMRHVNEIRNAGRHLLRLLNDALDLSRIEANQITTDSVDIPLTALLDECVALIQPGANLKRINISTRYRYSADVTVIADPLRLKQVLVNLLSNAVKYNKPDGLITVVTALLNDAGMAAVHVTDTGAGISPDQMEKLFMPFTRLPQHEKEEGAGIGLALSKRLIELMGGRIGARSSAGGQTTFWIEIPTAKRGFRNGSK
jgi:PAS domain S-box-containing protein